MGLQQGPDQPNTPSNFLKRRIYPSSYIWLIAPVNQKKETVHCSEFRVQSSEFRLQTSNSIFSFTMAAPVTLCSSGARLLNHPRTLATSRSCSSVSSSSSSSFSWRSSKLGFYPVRHMKNVPAPRNLVIRAARTESKGVSLGFRPPQFQVFSPLLLFQVPKLEMHFDFSKSKFLKFKVDSLQVTNTIKISSFSASMQYLFVYVSSYRFVLVLNFKILAN